MNAPRRTLLTRSQFQARRSTPLPHILLLKQRLRPRITPDLFETEATVMCQVYEQPRVEGPWPLQRAEALLAEYSTLLPTPIPRAATVSVDGSPDPDGAVHYIAFDLR